MINCQPNCAASHRPESTEQSQERETAEMDGLQAECSLGLFLPRTPCDLESVLPPLCKCFQAPPI